MVSNISNTVKLKYKILQNLTKGRKKCERTRLHRSTATTMFPDNPETYDRGHGKS